MVHHLMDELGSLNLSIKWWTKIRYYSASKQRTPVSLTCATVNTKKLIIKKYGIQTVPPQNLVYDQNLVKYQTVPPQNLVVHFVF